MNDGIIAGRTPGGSNGAESIVRPRSVVEQRYRAREEPVENSVGDFGLGRGQTMLQERLKCNEEVTIRDQKTPSG